MREQNYYIGVELGSTRIKAVLVGQEYGPLSSGEFVWENKLENGVWTYGMNEVWQGMRSAVGALISEYPPGTEPKGSNFPIRNRIISGLSVGVIAVESGRYGGTLLTVRHATEQNREVFAVPGPVGAPESEGTNRLIQEGAKLILNADDVLCEFVDRFPGKLKLGWDAFSSREAEAQRLEGAAVVPERREPVQAKEKPAQEKKSELPVLRWAECRNKLTDDQRALLLALDGGAMVADDLVERTQIPARRVMSAITLLQIQGYVAEESGKRFRAAVKLKME